MSTKKTITVTLSPWPSPYYPVQARCKLGESLYHTVWESYDQAKRHFAQRFYPTQVKFIVK